jgi:phosphatidylserine/phosphatidylglycerophosphate/cardiolipin synthase-like enzyme
VEHLFVDAIDAADQLIYIETQYFSSTRIRKALLQRMCAPDRSRLQIVVVVNERAEAFKEEIAVGLRQAKNVERLRQVAQTNGHALGVYFTVSDGAGEQQRSTYIHSKMMAVDDRFLTVGSANLTNRSLEVDSELHVSWEAAPGEKLCRGIRRLRVSLLAEHAGLAGPAAIRPLVAIPGLVERLNDVAARPGARLRVHGPARPGQEAAMKIIDPEDLPFDPTRAVFPDGEAEQDDECDSDRSYEVMEGVRNWGGRRAGR